MKLESSKPEKSCQIPKKLKSLVSSWLLAEAALTVHKMNTEHEIYAEILREIPLWADCEHGDNSRITNVDKMYLSTDERIMPKSIRACYGRIYCRRSSAGWL